MTKSAPFFLILEWPLFSYFSRLGGGVAGGLREYLELKGEELKGMKLGTLSPSILYLSRIRGKEKAGGFRRYLD